MPEGLKLIEIRDRLDRMVGYHEGLSSELHGLRSTIAAAIEAATVASNLAKAKEMIDALDEEVTAEAIVNACQEFGIPRNPDGSINFQLAAPLAGLVAKTWHNRRSVDDPLPSKKQGKRRTIQPSALADFINDRRESRF